MLQAFRGVGCVPLSLFTGTMGGLNDSGRPRCTTSPIRQTPKMPPKLGEFDQKTLKRLSDFDKNDPESDENWLDGIVSELFC